MYTKNNKGEKDMALTPIKKSSTLKEQAYEQIRQAINTNTLKPGTFLTETGYRSDRRTTKQHAFHQPYSNPLCSAAACI